MVTNVARSPLQRVFLLVLLAGLSPAVAAAEAVVAVAANFTAPAQRIAAEFEQHSGHKLRLSFGSTGKFYSQIVHGAPFDVLLAADTATPQRLATEGRAVAGSGYTYALGKLVLWSAQPGTVDAGGEVLRHGRFARLAIANPKLAPYGAAAQQALQNLGLWDTLAPRLVTAENIAQAYQFIATGNAELGFVALAQIRDKAAGSWWLVPEPLYAPIRQDVVLLVHGAGNDAARAFIDYLHGAPARAVIHDFGYGLP